MLGIDVAQYDKTREVFGHLGAEVDRLKANTTHIVSPCSIWPVLSNAAGGVEGDLAKLPHLWPH